MPDPPPVIAASCPSLMPDLPDSGYDRPNWHRIPNFNCLTTRHAEPHRLLGSFDAWRMHVSLTTYEKSPIFCHLQGSILMSISVPRWCPLLSCTACMHIQCYPILPFVGYI